MNRRIPNGMYGGVGGRELAAPSYPIYLLPMQVIELKQLIRSSLSSNASCPDNGMKYSPFFIM